MVSKLQAIFVLVLLAVGSAHADPIHCRPFRDELFELLRGVEGEPMPLDVLKPTLRRVERLEGRHGGHRYVYELVGDTWGSSYASAKFDAQGDPRWIFDQFGKEGAKFFGIELVGANKIILPDAREVQGAVEALNKELRARGLESIPIQFYDSGVKTTEGSNYLSRYVDEFGLPIMTSEHGLLHDLNFHLSAILLPKDLLAYSAERIRFERAFFKYLRAKYAKNPKMKSMVMFYEKNLMKHQLELIDEAAAGFASDLAFQKAGIESNLVEGTLYRHVTTEKVAQEVVEHGKDLQSPVKALKRELEGVRNENKNLRKLTLANENIPLSPVDLWEDLDAFAATYKSELSSFNASKPYVGYTPATFAEEISRRRQTLRAIMERKP